MGSLLLLLARPHPPQAHLTLTTSPHLRRATRCDQQLHFAFLEHLWHLNGDCPTKRRGCFVLVLVFLAERGLSGPEYAPHVPGWPHQRHGLHGLPAVQYAEHDFSTAWTGPQHAPPAGLHARPAAHVPTGLDFKSYLTCLSLPHKYIYLTQIYDVFSIFLPCGKIALEGVCKLW